MKPRTNPVTKSRIPKTKKPIERYDNVRECADTSLTACVKPVATSKLNHPKAYTVSPIAMVRTKKMRKTTAENNLLLGVLDHLMNRSRIISTSRSVFGIKR